MKSATVFLFVTMLALAALNGYQAGDSASASASSSASSSSNDGSGSASAGANARSRGGVASAVAGATSEIAKSKVGVEIQRIFVRIRGIPNPTCKSIHRSIGIYVEQIGLAFAKALSDAFSIVDVTGEGSACAYSDASAQASARSFVRAIASALVAIKSDLTLVKAEAYVEVFFGVYVSAFSNAWTDACINGEGFAYAFQTSLAKALARPIAAVLVWVEAGIDCRGAAGFALAEGAGFADIDKKVDASSDSDTAVVGDGSANADGDATASVDKIKPCGGVHLRCCNPKLKAKCFCQIGGRNRCDLHRSEPGSKLWMDNANKPVCSCRR